MIVAWTQTVATVAWLVFFAVTGQHVAWAPGAGLAVVASSLLVIGMSGLLARASSRGDISIVGPVFALSPIFTVVPDSLLAGGLPSPLGWLGLALSLVGVGSLSGRAPRSLRALFRRHDALDALGAAVLLGMLAAVDRWGALAIGPPSYLLASHGVTAFATGTLAVATNPRGVGASLKRPALYAVIGHGLLGVTGTAMQTSALTMAPAAYVNAIRRMSAVAAVLLGGALFREADVGRRLTAAVVTVAGAACLLLAR